MVKNSFSNISTSPSLENTEVAPPVIQKFQLCLGYINSKGTSLLLGRSSNSQHNLKYIFRKQNKLEFGFNSKGVQIFWEKSINSPKIFLDLIFNTVNLY
jgi:hypothetical protein